MTEAAPYGAPQGKPLTDAAIVSIARSNAALAHDPAPNTVTAVNTSLKNAIEASQGNPLPAAPDSVMAELESGVVSVVTMHGDFRLTNARTPAGAVAPTGRVLTLIVNAYTGQVEGRGISEEDPPSIAALGTPRQLE